MTAVIFIEDEKAGTHYTAPTGFVIRKIRPAEDDSEHKIFIDGLGFEGDRHGLDGNVDRVETEASVASIERSFTDPVADLSSIINQSKTEIKKEYEKLQGEYTQVLWDYYSDCNDLEKI